MWLAFASRNRKEMTRDLLTLLFGIALPIVLICMMSLIFQNIGDANPSFAIENLAPGIAVFSLSFVTLFLGMLVASDRESAFLVRILTSPMKNMDYILGYGVPAVPLAMLQALCCFLCALLFGFRPSINLLLAFVLILPCALLYIALGLLFGTVFSQKQVGGMSSVLINLAAWMSGAWFPVSAVGGVFESICGLLPFSHAVEMVRCAVAGNLVPISGHLLWVCGYTAVILFFAVRLFLKKTKA